MLKSQQLLNKFQFLERFWPDLHDLGNKAENAASEDPEVAAIRLRGFSERMVEYLFKQLGYPLHDLHSHFDRLIQLERGDLLDARLLAKLHTIRKVGNRGAHNRKVTTEQAETLLVDAWSLACWFCRFMRPDVEWLIRPYGIEEAQSVAQPQLRPDRQSTASTTTSNVLKFPEDRIRRIRDEVARALSQVDPRVRQLRTRITMREAFTEQLNEDQQACLEALETFLTDRDQRIFLLKGDAGTGKTFLARGLVEYLSAQGRACQLGAPTGRAAKIIGEKSGRDARTLHSLIYDYRALKEYGGEDGSQGLETFKVYADIANNRDQANTVYIVDEASLLSDAYSESDFFRSGTGYLLQDLFAYVGFNQSENDRKIIFLGDPAQLPPVGMNTSPALDANYLREHFGHTPVSYHLKQVVRQKADSGVLRNVRPLRNGLETKTFRGLRFDFDEDVRCIHADDVLPLYMMILASPTTELPIIITWSNREAGEFNRTIRSRLFPGRDTVAKGDRLLIMANTFVGGQFLANGEFVKVAAVEAAVERRTVTLRQRVKDSGEVESHEIDLHFRDVDVAISLPDGTETVQSVKLLDDLLHDGQSGLSAEQQRALYVDFLKRHPDLRRAERSQFAQVIGQDPYFNAVRAKFGYAVTCHKAQGGEWEDVFVVCPKKEPRSAEYFRWLYTAMTRSSCTLYLVDPPEVRIKPVGPELPEGAGSNTSSTDSPQVAVSPLESFRRSLLARVRGLLVDPGVVIDDVAHQQYQESYYVSRASDACRVNFNYKSTFKIGAINIAQESAFRDELVGLLSPLVGQVIAPPDTVTNGTGVATTAPLSRPFLKDFDDSLLPLLAARNITVVSLKEQQWSQRYTFARGTESAVVDIYYDGRDRFKNCVPISPNAFSGSSSHTLLRDVLEIITTEIIL